MQIPFCYDFTIFVFKIPFIIMPDRDPFDKYIIDEQSFKVSAYKIFVEIRPGIKSCMQQRQGSLFSFLVYWSVNCNIK